MNIYLGGKDDPLESKTVHRGADHRCSKESAAGASVADLCCIYDLSDATYYNWKAEYSGMTVSDLNKLKDLKDENCHLKQIVADQALDIRALKDLQTPTQKASLAG